MTAAPHWSDVRMYLAGRKTPSKLGAGGAREGLLREWAEGDRRRVVRVEDAKGRELDPAEVDWSGMSDPPRLRAGSPVRTGRGTVLGRQILVRVSADEAELLAAGARRDGVESVPAWLREIGLAAARAR